MRRYLLPLPAMAAITFVLSQPVAAQEKEKPEHTQRAERIEKVEIIEKAEKARQSVAGINEEIVIKRKSDKDGKVTIEIKGDDVIVNGKPIDDYEDDNMVIRKRRSMAATLHSSPFRGQSGAAFFNGDSDWFPDSGIPFFGVIAVSDENGAEVEQVTAGSAAEKAGLKEGDIIIRVDEYKIENPDDLTRAVRKHKPEDKVIITYQRNGKTEKAAATLGKRKNQLDLAMPRLHSAPDLNFNWQDGPHGWTITPKARLGIKAQDTEDGKGVKVLDVAEESAAEKAGIKEGDIITGFDGKKVDTADELLRFAREAQDAQKTVITITFTRNGKSQTADLKTPRKLKTANL